MKPSSPSVTAGTLVVAFLTMGAAAYAQVITEKNEPERPASQFAIVNGVKLHYLDWGGKGEALLFLTSLGGTAGDFQPQQ